MSHERSLSPTVRSILEAAEGRTGDKRVDVDARSFPEAVKTTESTGKVPIIAEVKPTSPTTEGVRSDDPVTLAKSMEDGGATAISVLTEPTHFGGSIEALERVRAAVDLPVLRKDFVLSEGHLDLVEADMILLIARFVDDLPDLIEAARSRGFQPLVEVHDRSEAAEAVSAGADIIGINNRDLSSLKVDLSTFESVVSEIPGDVITVAESGIRTASDVKRMRHCGADALLIGTAIMEGDVRTTTATFATAGNDDD